MTRVRVPAPTSGGLMLSYKCSAECRHCMYACSPRWNGDWLSEQEIEDVLTLLAPYIRPSPWGEHTMSLNYGLHFTGGEPFLRFDLLLRAVEVAGDLGIPSTFVETNCSWCVDDRIARERLELLKRGGLRGILISVNPFYAEYVPFARTSRCIRISREVFGRNVIVYQEAYYHQFKRLGLVERLSLKEYVERTDGEHWADNVELFLMGRAVRRLRAYYPAHPARAFFRQGCRPPFLREWHNHFDNYGNLVPGYCGGISLGDWRDLDRLTREGIDLEEHPVLRFLVAEDVEGLFRFSQDLGYRESEKGYLSKCDLCLDLRQHLVSHGDFGELAPRAFYVHVG